jgi:Tfp pilus assembly protein PilO
MRARLPKLGRTARWILTIGIILIPIIVLGVTYGQHLAEESDLRADIDTANAQLSSGLHILAQREAVRNQTQAELQENIDEVKDEVNQTQTDVWDNINGTVEDLSDVDLLLGGVISGLDDIDDQFHLVILQQLDNLTQQEFPYNYTQSIEIGDELFQAADDAHVNISSYTSSLPHEETIDGVRYQVFSISLSVQGQVPDLLDFNIKVSQRFPDCNFKSVSIDMPEEEGGVASMSFNLEIYCYA